MKRTFWAIPPRTLCLLLAALICSALVASPEAFGAPHWPTREITVLDAMSQDHPALRGAVASWNRTGLVSLLIDPAGSGTCQGSSSKIGGSNRQKIVVCSRAMGKNDLDGQTDYSWNGFSEIYKAVVVSNTSYKLGKRQRRSVLCHELGHALGLPHLKGGGCMDNSGKYNPEPSSAETSFLGNLLKHVLDLL